MTIINGHITAATVEELYTCWMDGEFYHIMSFDDYLFYLKRLGVQINPSK